MRAFPLPSQSATISRAALERYRKEALKAIGRTKSKRHDTPPPAAASSSVVIGFYAPWQPAGLSSLRSNAGRLTHLMPEWLQSTRREMAWTFTNTISRWPLKRAIHDIAAKSKLQIWPILNNHDGTKFDPERVHRLLSGKLDAQRKFAETLRDWLLQEKCLGVNLDFESLKEADNARMAAFAPLPAERSGPGALVSLDLSGK